jgi:hypothetical protein
MVAVVSACISSSLSAAISSCDGKLRLQEPGPDNVMPMAANAETGLSQQVLAELVVVG